ncbi:hypothetical protein [Streptomyces lucensis]|uniref:hypothetical protein n=1 Tax=Streptomyces lucensis TaxID=67319 RepID=UPI0035711C80
MSRRRGNRRIAAAVTASVREWRDEEGWGVLDSPETPGGCLGHYADVQAPGFPTLPTARSLLWASTAGPTTRWGARIAIW